jgi:glyoxylase-like metal-dependent hydrolase (beta-lactamase superfamily II)
VVWNDPRVSTHVHHLNCATLAPAAGRLPGLAVPRMVAHCLLVESDESLTLVDTGFGTADLAAPRQRLGAGFVTAVRPRLDPDETAVARVRALGYAPQDVRDIVVTHLDLDHAGGLADFPRAAVHVFGEELDAARQRGSARERSRYVSAQWAHGPRWVEHATGGGETWFGFPSVGLIGDDVLMVPLRGHTRGHAGVAVRRPSGGWFLHAGDAYFFAGEKERPASCPAGLRVFQRLVEMDRPARRESQERLRGLVADHGDEVTVFSAHDAAELEALAGRTD